MMESPSTSIPASPTLLSLRGAKRLRPRAGLSSVTSETSVTSVSSVGVTPLAGVLPDPPESLLVLGPTSRTMFSVAAAPSASSSADDLPMVLISSAGEGDITGMPSIAVSSLWALPSPTQT